MYTAFEHADHYSTPSAGSRCLESNYANVVVGNVDVEKPVVVVGAGDPAVGLPVLPPDGLFIKL